MPGGPGDLQQGTDRPGAVAGGEAEVARSPARYRCLLAGRRAGKSRLLALLATWTAFRKPGASVVLISAGETASLRVLADVTTLLPVPPARGVDHR